MLGCQKKGWIAITIQHGGALLRTAVGLSGLGCLPSFCSSGVGRKRQRDWKRYMNSWMPVS